MRKKGAATAMAAPASSANARRPVSVATAAAKAIRPRVEKSSGTERAPT
jgi:hypothetical protein